jgi:hypothetical protein
MKVGDKMDKAKVSLNDVVKSLHEQEDVAKVTISDLDNKNFDATHLLLAANVAGKVIKITLYDSNKESIVDKI